MARQYKVNEHQMYLLRMLAPGEALSIGEMARFVLAGALWWCQAKGRSAEETYSKAQSIVRNALRRLVADKWCKQVGRGTYKLTKEGQTRIALIRNARPL